MALEEKTFISQFNCQPDGSIGVQKTTQVLKDGVVLSESYWRVVLGINDPEAVTVLDEPYYLNLATYAWTMTPPSPYIPPQGT